MSYAYLPLASILPLVSLAKEWKVSEVARSSRGFLTAYKRAGGDPSKLTAEWSRTRENFIKRHMAQVKARGEDLWPDGRPSRRHLALIMWAYTPTRARYDALLQVETRRRHKLGRERVEKLEAKGTKGPQWEGPSSAGWLGRLLEASRFLGSKGVQLGDHFARGQRADTFRVDSPGAPLVRLTADALEASMYRRLEAGKGVVFGLGGNIIPVRPAGLWAIPVPELAPIPGDPFGDPIFLALWSEWTQDPEDPASTGALVDYWRAKGYDASGDLPFLALVPTLAEARGLGAPLSGVCGMAGDRWVMVDTASRRPWADEVEGLPVEWPELKRPPKDFPSVRSRRIYGSEVSEKEVAKFPGVRPTSRKWKPNERVVREALQRLGIRPTDDKLGCGSYGCAYLGEPYVVKITSDASEAANARKVVEAGGLPGVIDIKAVYAVEDSDDFYVLLTEPLQPLTKKEEAWVDKHRVDFRFAQYYNGDISSTELRRYIKVAKEESDQKLEAHVSDLIRSAHALYELGVKYEDGHSGNVMARVGEDGERYLVYIDLGHSEGPRVEVPVLGRPKGE